MACGQVDADGCPERHAGDVCLLDANGTEEAATWSACPWVE
jgi:hypothetical protein